jgi:hypothetical protein
VGRNAQIALAVGIGYLLGRRRKLRTALTLGAAAAVGRLGRDPQAIVRQGSKLLGTGPQLGPVAGLTRPLAAAGKAAAAAAVSHGIDSVGDRMRRKANALRSTAAEGAAQPGRAAPAEAAEQAARAEGEEAERAERAEREEAEREEAPQPPRPVRPRAARPSATGRTRRRPAEGETGEAAPPVVRRAPRERPTPGGAPVRRRGGER